MDKRVASAEAAVARIQDGATILMGGFGAAGVPENLIRALGRRRRNVFTVVSNNAGISGYGIDLLLKNKQVKKMIASFVGGNKTFEQLALKKEIELELNPQGAWRSGFAAPEPASPRSLRRRATGLWPQRERKSASSMAGHISWFPHCAEISPS